MDLPKNNQEFYARLDDVCNQLNRLGMSEHTNRITYLLHKVAWTSSTELFEELEPAIQIILSGEHAQDLPKDIKEELELYLDRLKEINVESKRRFANIINTKSSPTPEAK